MKISRDKIQIVSRNGKATAVILDIDEYEALLEELEQHEDLLALKEARDQSADYQTLEEYSRQRAERVSGSHQTGRET